MILNYLKSFIISVFGLFIFLFLLTLLNYFNIINGSVLSVLEIIISVLALFVGGMFVGRGSNSKGYLHGIYLGIIISIIFLASSLIFFDYSFEIKSLLFYLILIVSSMIGAMVGISKVEKN